MPGKFVTFEGGEGAGKTTVLALVAQELKDRGWSVLTTREPGAGEVGAAIRQLLLHSGEIPPTTELLLFLADRSNHVETIIKPALAKGTVVLCDRFVDSTTVYQAHVRGLDASFIQAGNRFATSGLVPDRTYLLDVPVEIGLARAKGGDRLDAMPAEFHEKVREGFLKLAQQDPARWRTLDASQSASSVASAIIEDLTSL